MGGPDRWVLMPSQWPHPCQPSFLYVWLGAAGMLEGRAPVLRHTRHSLVLASPREQAYARASPNERNTLLI